MPPVMDATFPSCETAEREASDTTAWARRFHARLNGRTIPGLDGARALAVMLVIANHFGFEFINGALGVMIFFVLSGFLITWIMLKEVGRTGTVSLRGFYTRRVLRIFPAFYAFWLVAIGIALLREHPIDWAQAVSAFFYVGNYQMGLFPADGVLFGHTWSLSIEEQFYLLWPVVFLLGIRRLRRLPWLLGGIIGAVWIHRAALFVLFGVRQEYIYRAFDTRLDHLMVGCLLAVLLHRGSLDTFCQRITARRWYPALTLGVLFAAQLLHKSMTFTFTVGYALEPLLAAALLIQLVWFSSEGFWSGFELPVVTYLGRISYPLYLWQQLTLFTSKRLLGSQGQLLQFAFAVAVTVLFASASYYIVEKPFLRLKSRF
jgi:peptidoglycan/LPS O-acetylase OafA/YrhL